MLISHDKKFIYLKTIKTAGTSVEIFFQEHCLPKAHPCHLSPTHLMNETISNNGIVGHRGNSIPDKVKYYNHMPAHEIKMLVGDDIWENYFKFCVIRNPFDKVVSWWWFQLSENQRNEYAFKDFNDIKANFKDWLLSTETFPHDDHIYKINNVICVDSFINYENLIHDTELVSQKLNIIFDITKLKRYKSGYRKKDTHFSEYYDNETATVVKNKFSWEISTFGYVWS